MTSLSLSTSSFHDNDIDVDEHDFESMLVGVFLNEAVLVLDSLELAFDLDTEIA